MKPEFIVEKENIRTLVKLLATAEGRTLIRLKVDINYKFNKTDSLENLTNKLRNRTVKLTEFLERPKSSGINLLLRRSKFLPLISS